MRLRNFPPTRNRHRAPGWAAAVLFAALAPLAAVTPASAQPLTWVLDKHPAVAGTVSPLMAVSCPSTTFCVGVGDRYRGTLTEIWNGTTWSIAQTPSVTNGSLSAVSCPSADACMAVGGAGRRTLAETWNGSQWTVVSTGNVRGALGAVSCVSISACTAVGFTNPVGGGGKTLIETWNGSAWSRVKSPNQGIDPALTGVSCAAADSCVAVGENVASTHPLIESWNGVAWSLVPVRTPADSFNTLLSVSCPAVSACVAVGSTVRTAVGSIGKPLVESWDGHMWTTTLPSAPTASSFDGIACLTLANCTAVGIAPAANNTANTLAESWNGTIWSQETTPDGTGAFNQLSATSCPSSGLCMAVGYTSTIFGSKPRTLAETGTAGR